jgi:transposase
MGPDEIRQALAGWKRNNDERDRLVRLAHEADIPIREISQITGISRTTIYRILGLEPGGVAAFDVLEEDRPAT